MESGIIISICIIFQKEEGMRVAKKISAKSYMVGVLYLYRDPLKGYGLGCTITPLSVGANSTNLAAAF